MRKYYEQSELRAVVCGSLGWIQNALSRVCAVLIIYGYASAL